MKKQQPKNCPTCGHKIVEYPHGLTKTQVRPLAKLAIAGGGPLNISDDLDLDKGEYTNFAKLAYWKLVKKAGDEKRGGNWQITELGREFVAGLVRLHKTVWVYRGDVQRFEGKRLYITDVTGGWKYRPDHARDARPLEIPGQGALL